ncbi:low molecular weight protein tyrosine phosphatase family protein [Zavarzinella formosa]|uniref:low molecular weight protein tyrosine phosphatase family protein n=1 Tax=Zavarzinella formosa TaxID=360055 RepID=UPI0002E56EA7|nr:hypothetical protein [Zavarzinella formosa]
MARAKQVLFVCEGNLHRSPTAERLYSTSPGLKTRSAGLSEMARIQITPELLDWADVVFVMEQTLLKMIRRRFPDSLIDKELVCLRIPDDYQFMQPELLAILTERLMSYLGQPTD